MTQCELDVETFKAKHPHVRAHDIPEWWADGVGHGRRDLAKQVIRLLEDMDMEGEDNWDALIPRLDELCDAVLQDAVPEPSAAEQPRAGEPTAFDQLTWIALLDLLRATEDTFGGVDIHVRAEVRKAIVSAACRKAAALDSAHATTFHADTLRSFNVEAPPPVREDAAEPVPVCDEYPTCTHCDVGVSNGTRSAAPAAEPTSPVREDASVTPEQREERSHVGRGGDSQHAASHRAPGGGGASRPGPEPEGGRRTADAEQERASGVVPGGAQASEALPLEAVVEPAAVTIVRDTRERCGRPMPGGYACHEPRGHSGMCMGLTPTSPVHGRAAEPAAPTPGLRAAQERVASLVSGFGAAAPTPEPVCTAPVREGPYVLKCGRVLPCADHATAEPPRGVLATPGRPELCGASVILGAYTFRCLLAPDHGTDHAFGDRLAHEAFAAAQARIGELEAERDALIAADRLSGDQVVAMLTTERAARSAAEPTSAVLRFLAHPYATRIDTARGEGPTAHWLQRVSVEAEFDGSDCCVEDRHVHAHTIEAACEMALEEMAKRPPEIPAPSMHALTPEPEPVVQSEGES